ncbi:hypothetical protein PLICRDRAFT_455896 [Plicaturopsis crispa FD-325 SS-3]|uniref:Uncharacterized protein n=1 Tax=Plicaturopsis crispa FD-325 SS-3 TaxID=944288 RepID=A0A0C9SPH3_PLICR|nr:hypothetical protein PLICRDRAFT_455896 [Plicaturopsis crispa FD-325 SS-3]
MTPDQLQDETVFQVTGISPQTLHSPIPVEHSDRVSVTVVAVNRERSAYVTRSSTYYGLRREEVVVMRYQAGELPENQRAWKEERQATLSRTLYGVNYHSGNP